MAIETGTTDEWTYWPQLSQTERALCIFCASKDSLISASGVWR